VADLVFIVRSEVGVETLVAVVHDREWEPADDEEERRRLLKVDDVIAVRQGDNSSVQEDLVALNYNLAVLGKDTNADDAARVRVVWAGAERGRDVEIVVAVLGQGFLCWLLHTWSKCYTYHQIMINILFHQTKNETSVNIRFDSNWIRKIRFSSVSVVYDVAITVDIFLVAYLNQGVVAVGWTDVEVVRFSVERVHVVVSGEWARGRAVMVRARYPAHLTRAANTFISR